MDNPEELLHSLAEFVKLKPKEIPADLEQYLSYVAKTGDPIYQWPLVKALFREKLLNVITEFYETCPTSADPAPACPNVDFFNYETMKVGLVERLESFASAPFTVQRLCELLTAPRKQYSRADKFMRAVEKNMLVVSTREPGPQRVGQDVDMSNGEDKSWLGRQPVAASVDRAPGLELSAFRYEPFGSSPGTAFFPPLKQKLDDFLETDAAVSAIAPQAANLANLAAISPEQVASLAATIGPDVANLAVEMSPEVANLAAEIPPEVASLAAEIPPEVVASVISPEVASLAAEIAPVVASLASEIPPDVAGLELTPLIDAANTATNNDDAAAGSANTADEDANIAANPTTPSDSEPGLPQEQQENVAAEEKMDVTETAAVTEVLSTNQGPAEEPANQGEVEKESTNQEAALGSCADLQGANQEAALGTCADLQGANELPANQGQDEKMSVDEDLPIPANQGEAETLPANQGQDEKSPANEEEAGKTAAYQDEAALVPANEGESVEVIAVETEKPLVEADPTNESAGIVCESTNELEAEKQQEDRRQVQSERVQSVIRETVEDCAPPAKVPRIDEGDS